MEIPEKAKFKTDKEVYSVNENGAKSPAIEVSDIITYSCSVPGEVPDDATKVRFCLHFLLTFTEFVYILSAVCLHFCLLLGAGEYLFGRRDFFRNTRLVRMQGCLGLRRPQNSN